MQFTLRHYKQTPPPLKVYPELHSWHTPPGLVHFLQFDGQPSDIIEQTFSAVHSTQPRGQF